MGARVIRLGTRASALARAQSALMASALVEAHPELEVEIVTISTSGDRSQSTNQAGADWGTGVFVKEIESALLREEIDLAVHSLKDVPPLITAGLTLAAIPVREDPLDVLVTTDGRGLGDLEPGCRVGTTSARRSAFLRASRPDLQFAPIRGNVETRLRKASTGPSCWRAPGCTASKSMRPASCSTPSCYRQRRARALWRSRRAPATARSRSWSSRCTIRPQPPPSVPSDD